VKTLKPIVPMSGQSSGKRSTAWAPSRRGTSSQRGYGAAWQRLRLVILERDQHLCQTCMAEGRVTVATQVDHIKPKFEGGTDDESNLQAICSECHDAKSKREGQRARSGS
jgi:5-methylcytosine-specific restriction protein A